MEWNRFKPEPKVVEDPIEKAKREDKERREKREAKIAEKTAKLAEKEKDKKEAKEAKKNGKANVKDGKDGKTTAKAEVIKKTGENGSKIKELKGASKSLPPQPQPI